MLYLLSSLYIGVLFSKNYEESNSDGYCKLHTLDSSSLIKKQVITLANVSDQESCLQSPETWYTEKQGNYSNIHIAFHKPSKTIEIFPPFGCAGIICWHKSCNHQHAFLAYFENSAWNEKTCFDKTCQYTSRYENGSEVISIYGYNGKVSRTYCGGALINGREDVVASEVNAERRRQRLIYQHHLNALGIALDSCAPPLPKGFLCTGKEGLMALESFRSWAEVDPTEAAAWYNLGTTQFTRQLDADAALLSMVTAATLNQSNPLMYRAVARLLVLQGHTDLGYMMFNAVMDGNQQPSVALLVDFAEIASVYHLQSKAIGALEDMLQQKEVTPYQLPTVHFALGKLYDSEHNYEAAFHHYNQGNGLHRKLMVEYGVDLGDPSADLQAVTKSIPKYILDNLPSWDVLMAQTQKEHIPKDLQQHAQGGNAANSTVESFLSGAVPVFIVGLPRSGSSLLEQIMVMHSTIAGSGEACNFVQYFPHPSSQGTVDKRAMVWAIEGFLQCLRDYVTRGITSHVITKVPAHLQVLGYIWRLLPNAVFFLTERNPVDVALSNYFQLYAEGNIHSYNLRSLGTHYAAYLQVVDYWREEIQIPITRVYYEELVEDLESTVSHVLAELGLHWESQCANFSLSSRAIYTASNMQVRRPLYGSSLGRWRNYFSLNNTDLQEMIGDMKKVWVARKTKDHDYLSRAHILVKDLADWID